MIIRFSLFALITGILVTACSPSKTLSTQNFSSSETSADSALTNLPNYKNELASIAGKGRALVSEPGNNERVTIDFESNREQSLLTIRNRIGIEGGQLLVDQDSVLIYNKIDKEAQKISIFDGRMTSLNELASINIIDLLNFNVEIENVKKVFENEASFKLVMDSGAEVYISKNDQVVWKVVQPGNIQAPYSEIIYEGYGEIEGFKLPRQITIFSTDKKSKVAFLIRTLNINPNNLNLQIDIPNDIKIERL